MGSGHHQLIFGPSACHGNMVFQIGNNTQMFPAGTRSMISMEENPRIRPFLTSPDEIYDEEYYDELSPEKKRRLTTEQVHQLEKSFEVENKLEPERKTELAKKLGLQPRQVAVWFQNRRARWKTKQLERDYDLLKSSYDSLMVNYDAIIKENDKLKSEVITLNDKLQGKTGVDHEPIIPDPGGPEPELALDPFQVDSAQDSAQLFNLKADDRLSSGSGGGSALVNNEDTNPQLVVDSTDHNCYFPDHHEDNYPTSIGPFPSDGDDGSDECPSYGSDVFVTSTSAADQQHHHHHQEEEGEAMGWWVW